MRSADERHSPIPTPLRPLRPDPPPRRRSARLPLPRRDGLGAAPFPFPPDPLFGGPRSTATALRPRDGGRRPSTSRRSAGHAVAKGAVLGIVDDVPFAGIEYVPGRTLDRLFYERGAETIPLPIEHALLIGEKLLVALEAAKPFEKKIGAPHGFLTSRLRHRSRTTATSASSAPAWTRGSCRPSRRPTVHAAYGPYIAPEVASTGKPCAAGDIYSAAAILFQALVGHPPAPGAGADALAGAVLAVDGEPDPGRHRHAPRPRPHDAIRPSASRTSSPTARRSASSCTAVRTPRPRSTSPSSCTRTSRRRSSASGRR